MTNAVPLSLIADLLPTAGSLIGQVLADAWQALPTPDHPAARSALYRDYHPTPRLHRLIAGTEPPTARDLAILWAVYSESGSYTGAAVNMAGFSSWLAGDEAKPCEITW